MEKKPKKFVKYWRDQSQGHNLRRNMFHDFRSEDQIEVTGLILDNNGITNTFDMYSVG